jgi:hypothetical protein
MALAKHQLHQYVLEMDRIIAFAGTGLLKPVLHILIVRIFLPTQVTALQLAHQILTLIVPVEIKI